VGEERRWEKGERGEGDKEREREVKYILRWQLRLDALFVIHDREDASARSFTSRARYFLLLLTTVALNWISRFTGDLFSQCSFDGTIAGISPCLIRDI